MHVQPAVRGDEVCSAAAQHCCDPCDSSTGRAAKAACFRCRVPERARTTLTRIAAIAVLLTLGAAGALAQSFAIVITSSSPLPVATLGSSYSFTFTASPSASFTWSLATGSSLPAGLSLNAGTGELSGVPSVPGIFAFTVVATDPSGLSGSKAFSLTVMGITSATPLPSATQSASYSFTFTAAGGQTPYAWSMLTGCPSSFVTAPPPPYTIPGMTFNAATGTLSGVPTTAASHVFTIVVSDNNGMTVCKNFGFTVNPPVTVTTSTIPSGAVGVPYSASFSATGGQSPYTWAVTTGSLPPGLVLNSNGTITGTPTSPGPYAFIVAATDSNTFAPGIGSKAFTINVIAMLSTSPLPSAVMNSPYTFTFTAVGGLTPYMWTVTAGALPAGLTLATSGVLSGTPTAVTTATFTVTVSDSNTAAQASVSRQFTLAVLAAVTIQSASPLPDAVQNSPYSFTFTAAGGSGGYTWTSTGSLPSGLSLNSTTGELSGAPSAAPGVYSFTIIATDSGGRSGQKAFDLTILAPLTITTASPLPQGVEGNPFTLSFTASGGREPYSWSLSGGLPAGLTFTNGTISGTPSAASSSTITVTVSDSAGRSDTKTYLLTVRTRPRIITSSPLPDGTIDRGYTVQFSATGGVTPYTWSLTGGAPGLALDAASGILSGTPNALGDYTFTVTVRDASGITGQKPFTVRVVSGIPELEILTRSVPAFPVGVAVSFAFAGRGGEPPYTWTAQQGVPPGLTLRPDGSLTGTPTTEGTYRLSILLTDSAGRFTGSSFEVRVTGVPLTLDPAAPPSGILNSPYQHGFRASGGRPPYSFALTGGSLPAGLALDSGGAVSGSPTAAGASSFTITVTDAARNTASQQYSITINTGNLEITTAELPDGATGSPYAASLAARGGRQPYTWSITTGNLPAGLTLNARTGEITGTPQADGRTTFTVTVTDAAERTASRGFTINIIGRLRITTPSPLSDLTVGAPSNLVIAAAGGAPPYAFSLTAGAFPAGLQLESDGRVTGTPSATGSFRITVQVRDSRGETASRDYTGQVVAALMITTPAELPDATAGASSSIGLAATGGTPPYRWRAPASLPAGISLSDDGGLTISGGVPGQSSFTIEVVDSAARTASRTFTLNIRVPMLSGVSIDSPETPVPAGQPRLAISIAEPFPGGEIMGITRLSFAADAAVNADDPAVQFATGGRIATFRIPAGATEAVFTIPNQAIQTGTVAGTITIALTLQSGGLDVPCNCALTRTIQIPRSAPVIRSVRVISTGSGFNVEVAGYSTSREITRAAFRFAGNNLDTTEFMVPMSAVFAQWYQSGPSAQYGSQFLLTQPFTVQGSTADITSVTVILTNVQGDSRPETGNFR